eukprot:m.364467 g.364467  ORF g.364467 m.364467 type:complete len:206 (+) comp27158_c0_seq1:141-758(+)
MSSSSDATRLRKKAISIGILEGSVSTTKGKKGAGRAKKIAHTPHSLKRCTSVIPKKLKIKHTYDVVRPRSSKQRFLLALPGRLAATMQNGTLGQIHGMNTTTPSITIPLDGGNDGCSVTLVGTLIAPQKDILTLEMANSTTISCTNQFDSLFVFSEAQHTLTSPPTPVSSTKVLQEALVAATTKPSTTAVSSQQSQQQSPSQSEP